MPVIPLVMACWVHRQFFTPLKASDHRVLRSFLENSSGTLHYVMVYLLAYFTTLFVDTKTALWRKTGIKPKRFSHEIFAEAVLRARENGFKHLRRCTLTPHRTAFPLGFPFLQLVKLPMNHFRHRKPPLFSALPKPFMCVKAHSHRKV